MQLDTVNGLSLTALNFQTSSTGQVKLPSDTATDYDSNDNITLNRQSGRIITKSLTTASGSGYDLTLTNSLISANTKVFCSIAYGKGTNTNFADVIHAFSGAGTTVINIQNISGSSWNGTIAIDFIIFN